MPIYVHKCSAYRVYPFRSRAVLLPYVTHVIQWIAPFSYGAAMERKAVDSVCIKEEVDLTSTSCTIPATHINAAPMTRP